MPPLSVIYLIFNRPAVTRESFRALREARPERLFVVADGPRPGVPDDVEKCRQAREIATAVDWPCEVRTDFAETNLGVKRRVAGGLTWAFAQTEEAVVIEDDCVSDPSFFRFAAEMLERYRDDARVMCVSGDNFQEGPPRTEDSYYFSRYPHCWGWATWRRAWNHFDPDLKRWPELRDGGWLHDILQDEAALPYWEGIFDGCAAGSINSWAFPWTYSCWVQSGLTILPRVNLVRNIGFGADGTNTTSTDHSASRLGAGALPFPLCHPAWVIRDTRADAFTQRRHFAAPPPSLPRRALRRLRSFFP